MKYRKYRIGDVFITERCQNTKKEQFINCDTPYVTRTCFNNGVQQYCGNTARNSSKYSYSKAWNQQRINDDYVMLPVYSVKSPDYDLIGSIINGGRNE